VLVWHFGGIAAVTILAGLFGGYVLNCRCKGASKTVSR
jgi:hypothetical protein